MIKLSRLTDYGIVLMSAMAATPEKVQNAAELAAAAHLPLPTVKKLLRVLTREHLLASHRGVKGGYSLSRAPQDITVADVIRALEGPIGLTLCTAKAPSDCEHESLCPVQGHWQKISGAIRHALEEIRLSEMAVPLPRRIAALGGGRAESLFRGEEPAAIKSLEHPR